jgi:hypothetical protein
VPGTTIAARTAAVNTRRKTRDGLDWAKRAIDRAEIVIFFLLFGRARMA